MAGAKAFIPERALRLLLPALIGAALVLVFLAPSRAVELSRTVSRVDLTPALVFDTGTAAQPDEMIARYQAGAFGPAVSVSQFEANYAPERWAAVELTAPAITAGYILIDVAMASEIDLYRVDGDEAASLLSFSLFRPYDPEQHAGTRLVSAPVSVSPDAPVLLLAHIKYGPFRSVTMSFETPAAAQAQTAKDTARLAGFYAFGVAAILFFVALFAALESWTSLLYALLAFVGLLLMAFLDGLLFRYAYPNHPELQSAIGFFLIFLLAASGFLLAAHGFRTGHRLRAMRVSQGLAGMSGLGFLAALVSPGPYVAAFGNVMLAAMFLATSLGTRAWEAERLPAYRFGRWLALAAGVAITLLVLLPVMSEVRFLNVPMTAKAVYLVLLISTLITFTAQVKIIRRDHNAAIEAEIEALTREAELSRELLKTEQDYTLARDLARKRRQQLATASHDLRQPLMSLRMTVDAMAEDIDPTMRARLGEAFDYIADLSGSYLDDATGRGPAPETEPKAERFSLAIILDTVWQMFHEEAEAKGLRLRRVESSLETDVPALALMRIVSNLVSNAVKYTKTGGVLLGVRRIGGHPVITVSDTGPGMSADELEAFRAEGVKGETSEGHGLGLSVCYQLAAENELTLDARSVSGRGTTFSLQLPATIGGSTP